jgi:hypothetical protein
MRKALTFSIVLNIVLGTFLLWSSFFVTREKGPVPAQPQGSANTSSEQGDASPVAASETRSNDAEPAVVFRWNQLESSDYRTYIANLRRIGCPERTIKDIVTADVGSLYDARRQELRSATNASAGALLKQLESSKLEAELQRLSEEQVAVIAALLGTETNSLAVNTAYPPRARRESALDRFVTMPLVFQPANASALQLTEQQAQVLEELRQTFREEIGSDLDLGDPAYRRRWQAAQRDVDETLVGTFGVEFFEKYKEQVETEQARVQ